VVYILHISENLKNLRRLSTYMDNSVINRVRRWNF